MKNDYYIKECEIKGQSSPISSDKLEIILKQMKICICDIKCHNKHGTGFFCKIPFPNFFNLKPVLITNNHVLEEKDITKGNIIQFTLDDDKIQKEILITNKRRTYTNVEFDITIIELYPKEDSIQPDSFLDIDPQIFCEEPNKEFRNKEIYIIGNIKEYTHGLIKVIDEQGKDIRYYFSTKPGMSGSPIIILNNFKIIGIHKGSSLDKKYNLGSFLREPFKLFYSLNSENNKDEEISSAYEFNENKEFIKQNPNEFSKISVKRQIMKLLLRKIYQIILKPNQLKY